MSNVKKGRPSGSTADSEFAMPAEVRLWLSEDSPEGRDRWLSPWTVGELLEETRAAVGAAAENIARFEDMSLADLAAASVTFSALYSKVLGIVSMAVPPGLPHDPHVVEYREWFSNGMRRYFEELEVIHEQFPRELRQRFDEVKRRADAAWVVREAREAGARNAANERWQPMAVVREWAFAQRRASPGGFRRPLLRRILPEVRVRAKAAGVTLSPDDSQAISTIEGWFREAGIP